MHYLSLLERLHAALRPAAYLEIGVAYGDSFKLSRSPSVGIDPWPQIRAEALLGKPWIKLYASTSDEFFQTHSAAETLEGARLDLVFIDGLHQFVQVVRDLEHVEQWSHPETVVVVHDVLPRNPWEARRAYHLGAWTGDVWRVVPFLRGHRPDLRCWLAAADPSGMLIVTKLDPSHRGMTQLAEAADRDFPPDGPEYESLLADWLAHARPEPAKSVLFALTGAPPRVVPRRDAATPPWVGDRSVGTLEAVTERGMRWLPESSWRPVLQTSIDAYYDGRDEEGLLAGLRLLNAHGLPDEIRELTYRNLTYYARPLAELVAGARWHMIYTPSAADCAWREASPIFAGDRLTVLLRAFLGEKADVNFDVLMKLDDNLAAVEGVKLDDDTGVAARFETARLFLGNGTMQAGIILRDPHGAGAVQAGVVDLSGRWRNLRLLGPRAGEVRQGWSPLVTPDGPRFVGWWEPTEIWRLEQSGEFIRVALRLAPHLAERFEGGSQGVAVPGGYLFLVNERVSTDAGRQSVFSRFVRIDDDFQVTNVSPQFFVKEKGEDAASGLARKGDQLLTAFISSGSQPLLATMDLEATMATLIPVDAPGHPANL